VEVAGVTRVPDEVAKVAKAAAAPSSRPKQVATASRELVLAAAAKRAPAKAVLSLTARVDAPE
jgi:hypothetical protein